MNGLTIRRKRLDPGSIITIAKHGYEIQYNPELLGAKGLPPADDDQIDLGLRKTLMERAGLDRRDLEDRGANAKDDDDDPDPIVKDGVDDLDESAIPKNGPDIWPTTE